MTTEEEITRSFFQEKGIALENIDNCHFSADLTDIICAFIENKTGIVDEDIASNIDSLMRLASSFFALGTLFFIDKLSKQIELWD